MRDFKNMKRQRGRNRGGGNGGGGGGKPQQNVNRAFDSNGPDNVKIRGHAQHVFEKYQQLARDTFASGDRVLAENYLQHADHYFRVLRTIQPQRPAAEILGRDVFASGLDIDFEEEMDAAEEQAEMQGAGEGETQAESGGQDVRPARFEPRREFEGRNDRGERNERYDTRPERSNQDRPNQDRPDRERLDRDRQDRDRPDRERQEPRFDRQDRETRREPYEPREGRDRSDPREFRSGGDRFDRPSRRFRDDRPRETEGEARDPMAVVAVVKEASSFPAPESTEAEAAPVLRSQDGGVSQAPAFLQGAVGEEEPRRPRPRRRRAPRSFEGAEGAGEPAAEPKAASEDA